MSSRPREAAPPPPAPMSLAEDRTPMLAVRVGVALLAVATVAYVFAPRGWFGGAKRRKRARPGRLGGRLAADDSGTEAEAPAGDFFPPGLANMGNTCFVNSTLQALASLPSLVSYLEARVARHRLFQLASLRHRGRTAHSPAEIPVTESLLEILLELNSPRRTSHRVLRPSAILSALSRASSPAAAVTSRRWLGFEQQDAHELYQLLSSHLQAEHDACRGKKCGCCAGRGVGAAGLGEVLGPAPEKGGGGARALRNPALGLVGSRLRCGECGYETPVRHQTFDNLSLVPPHEPTISLAALLATYTSPEFLDDVVCPRCSLRATEARVSGLVAQARKRCEVARRVWEAGLAAEAHAGTVDADAVHVNGEHVQADRANGVHDVGAAEDAPQDSAPASVPSSPAPAVDPPGKPQVDDPAPPSDPQCLADLFPKLRGAPLPAATAALLRIPFSSPAEDAPAPPEDAGQAALRLDAELRKLHALVRDLGALQEASPDGFLEMEQDKLGVEKIRHVPTPPHRTSKRLTVSRFPRVLALHVQRSVYLASGRAVKNACRVGGIGETWDPALPPTRRRPSVFSEGPGGNPRPYRLRAVVLHFGSHDSGHFVVYRRMGPRGCGDPSWGEVEAALERIARGQDPEGRLEAWVEGWCAAVLGGNAAGTRRDAGAVQPGKQPAPLPLPRAEEAPPSPVSETAAPGPGDSPTLHGSADGDAGTDHAADTDTDAPPESPPGGGRAALPAAVGEGEPAEERWFRISDDSVELVEDPEREVYGMVSGQAYMIFYELAV
ncbi:hypothetical protein DFJ74DRAFT_479049 [Hyaloraphidium curvatum]|nr:hypothetical protein DFJ74DRAFT_479049 [Hyaloraphidium curvatum]